MASDRQWRDVEQSLGRDAHKLESKWGGGNVGVMLGVWLAFYVLAVTHSLLSPSTSAPAVTAEALQPSQAAPSRPVEQLLVPVAIQR